MTSEIAFHTHYFFGRWGGGKGCRGRFTFRLRITTPSVADKESILDSRQSTPRSLSNEGSLLCLRNGMVSSNLITFFDKQSVLTCQSVTVSLHIIYSIVK